MCQKITVINDFRRKYKDIYLTTGKHVCSINVNFSDFLYKHEFLLFL